MQLRFLGGAGSVTGARMLVEHQKHRVLLDCGLFQGLKRLRLRNRSTLGLPSGSLDAVVLTQAHPFHSGFLPLLVHLGFRGPVYASPGTVELCRLLLPAAARLQEAEAREANRLGYSVHSPALPLFTQDMAGRALEQLQPCEPEAWVDAAPAIQLRLHPAGLALGASSVQLRCGAHSLLYSGALGRQDDELMRPPAWPEGADRLLLDAAGGNRPSRPSEALARLARLLDRTLARGGNLLLPVDAAGPLQQLLHGLQRLRTLGRMPNHPIWLDSGTAAQAVALYQNHPEQLQASALTGPGLLDGIQVADGGDEIMDVARSGKPAVLITTEGVSLGHAVGRLLRELLPDRRHAVAYTCCPPTGSYGAALLAGASGIKVQGERVPAQAEVALLDGLCGRADRRSLLDWLGALPCAPEQLYPVLGEPDAADSLRQAIAERWHWNCSVPEQQELAHVLEPEPEADPSQRG